MPRVPMTPMVKLALYFLRIYLIFLLGLILLKFVLEHGHHSAFGINATTPPARVTTTPTTGPSTLP
jgi:hypothetical protein